MKSWYKAELKEQKVEVDIFDEIGGWGVTAETFRNDVKFLLDNNNKANTLVINIDSPGGSVFDGIAIYNFINSLKVKTVVRIEALAASIATVIALGADEVQMSSVGFFMIHNPWTIAMGEADDLRKEADTMDKIRDNLVNIYYQKTRIPKDQIKAMMDDETWLTAEEAKQKGFIDTINEAFAVIAANANKSEKYKEFVNQFNNIPKNLKMQENIENTEEVEEVVVEATEKVVNEATEETTEETTEEVENEEVEEVAEEETIFNKLKTFVNSLTKNEVSEELNNHVADLSGELKEVKAQLEDYKASEIENKKVAEDSFKALENLKSENESLKAELSEAKAKLSETVNEDLKVTGQSEISNKRKTFAEVKAEMENKK